MNNNKTVRILSLDGGGARGWLQLHFLQRFFNQAGFANLFDGFDLVAGSSVGSIIACGLAKGLTVQELKQFFQTHVQWIFTIRSASDLLSNDASYPSNKPNNIQKAAMFATNDPFYKAVASTSNYGDARLKTALTEVFGTNLLTSLNIPVLVTSYNYSQNKPIIFSNITSSAIPKKYRNKKIVDVIMSSAAAPLYFPSYELDIDGDPETPASKLIDGGLFQNNPSTLAISIARGLFPNAKRFCVLSVGTGEKTSLIQDEDEEEQADERSLQKYLNLLDIAMSSSEQANHIYFEAFSKLSADDNLFYYRFNILLDSQRDCDLDTSTAEFFTYLENAVDRKYLDDSYEIGQFISRLTDMDGGEGEPETVEQPGE